jgi:hemolysin III
VGGGLCVVQVYAAAMVSMFSASALYHVPTWAPATRHMLHRLDHAGIYFMIAGTYTPFCMLALPQDVGRVRHPS